MFSRIWKGVERRRFPREEAALEVELEIEIYGFEGESRPFFASGKTVNISRDGVLARLDLPVARGSVCKLFFRQPGDQVRPHHVAGRVARLSQCGDDFLIAVRFDEPLARLEITEKVAGAARA
jgi:hypothetical protein